MSSIALWIPFYNGSKLKLTSLRSVAYEANLAKLAREREVLLDPNNEDTLEAYEDILCEALANFILLDWEGVEISGKEYHYTPELGKQTLLKYPKLKQFVLEQAAQLQDYSHEIIRITKESLSWQFKWGENLEVLYNSWASTGKLPPALEKRPDVTHDVQFYLQSFFKLSNFRTMGFSSMGAIPMQDILAYAEMVGYTSIEDRAFFVDMITALDIEYRNLAHEKQERESEQKKLQSGNRSKPGTKRLG